MDLSVDPISPLSADELGKALGVNEEAVRLREQAGELFSIVRLQRSRDREYPAFQAWPGVAGEPLAQVLAILRDHSGTAAYGFFTSPNEELAGLTPIEVLVARVTHPRKLDKHTASLLSAPNNERVEAVLEAASAYAADLAA